MLLQGEEKVKQPHCCLWISMERGTWIEVVNGRCLNSARSEVAIELALGRALERLVEAMGRVDQEIFLGSHR